VKRKTWALAGGAFLVVVVAGAVAVIVRTAGAEHATPVAQGSPANTTRVEKGRLSATVSQDGTLTYQARSDGSPYPVVNQAHGTYTKLPGAGDKIGCGGVLYRVDDRPVLLLCGATPAYRDLTVGAEGKDVRQLNANLHQLGYDAEAHVTVDPADDDFTWRTAAAQRKLQQAKGLAQTGRLAAGDAVFLPRPVRIAKITGTPGGPAQPGAPVALATSDTLEVRVNLDASQQGVVRRGDRVRIILPGDKPAPGKVDRIGTVAQSTGKDGAPGDATIPAYITLDKPAAAGGLDEAPVQVEITAGGVENALSVPVTALVGRSGGGFAVEVVRDDGQRRVVAVELGLFDTSDGRVQVTGDLSEGDQVVVPSL
jgi:peptidoglycan hydrolase-like protein with peptidoglycan-binding domain